MVVETEVICPYCLEPFVLLVDTSQSDCEMIEDCTVCCRPIQFNIRSEPGQVLDIQTDRS